MPGNNYYRLKIVARDGTIQYSKIAVVRFTNTFELSVYPNPATDEIYVNSADELTRIMIYDLQGRLIKSFAADPGNRYSLQPMQKGLYTVNAISKAGIKTMILLVQWFTNQKQYKELNLLTRLNAVNGI